MSKRTPLSAEEKQIKLLELFHETNEVYQLKDLERLAPTEKGIVVHSVKTALQELVDSGIVQTAKLSGSIYFWSFLSENVKKSERQLNDIDSKTIVILKRIEEAQEQLKTKKAELENLPAIENLTKEIETLRKEKLSLETQIEQITKVEDYEVIKTKDNDAKILLEAANRWTDNIYITKTWCKRKFDKQDKELNKAFGIPEDLDYING